MVQLALNDLGTYSQTEIDTELLANGRVVRFRYELLDSILGSKGFLEDTIAPGGTIEYNWLADVKRQARFSIKESEDFLLIDFIADRIKPYFQLRMPDGLWASWPLGVFIPNSPARNSHNGVVMREITGFDQGIVLRQNRTPTRFAVPRNATVTAWISDILGDNNLPEALIQSGRLAPANREWEPGTSWAVIVNDLLASINYQSLYFDEHGVAQSTGYATPADRDIDVTYKTDEVSVISEDATETLDLFEVPNQWVLVISQPDRPLITATFTNTSTESPTSTVNRGRTVVDFRTSDDSVDQDAADERVRRIATEASQVYSELAFTTALMPQHGENMILYLEHLPLSIKDRYAETGWTFPLKAGSTMTHRARKVVNVD